jgi:hypothetical protein
MSKRLSFAVGSIMMAVIEDVLDFLKGKSQEEIITISKCR